MHTNTRTHRHKSTHSHLHTLPGTLAHSCAPTHSHSRPSAQHQTLTLTCPLPPPSVTLRPSHTHTDTQAHPHCGRQPTNRGQVPRASPQRPQRSSWARRRHRQGSFLHSKTGGLWRRWGCRRRKSPEGAGTEAATRAWIPALLTAGQVQRVGGGGLEEEAARGRGGWPGGGRHHHSASSPQAGVGDTSGWSRAILERQLRELRSH